MKISYFNIPLSELYDQDLETLINDKLYNLEISPVSVVSIIIDPNTGSYRIFYLK